LPSDSSIMRIFRRKENNGGGKRRCGNALPSKNIEFLSRKRTLEYVLDKGCSIARFGDGEMTLVFPDIFDRLRGIYFQKWSRQIRSRLEDILFRSVPNLLVCVNHRFASLDEYHVVLDYERSSKAYAGYLSVHKQDDVGILHRKKERSRGLHYLRKLPERKSIQTYGDATCFILCFFYEEYLSGRLSEVMYLYQRILAKKRVLFLTTT